MHERCVESLKRCKEDLGEGLALLCFMLAICFAVTIPATLFTILWDVLLIYDPIPWTGVYILKLLGQIPWAIGIWEEA